MTELGPYVRIQLDESVLERAMKQKDQRLDRHEEMILELQKLLRDKLDKSDLDAMRNSIMKEVENKEHEINSRISALEARLEARLKEMEENFENKLLDATNMLNLTLRQRLGEMEARIPSGGGGQYGDIADRLQSLEDTVFKNGKKLHETREYVQQVASSISLFNNTCAKLDNTLPDVLKASVTSVTDNIQSLKDELAKLKDQVHGISIVKQRAAEPVVIHDKGGGVDFDITSIKPYPSVVAHWRDPPELPPIHPFLNIGEVVDYIYRLVPKLQAHLTAMQAKIVENASDILGKVDKSLVEKMFEKFQSVIGEMAGRIDDLKDAVEQTATREEINDMVEDILNSMSMDGQTAVGAVKCMACGRDIPQVTGAQTEQEAYRSLGNAPNSMAFHNRSTNFGVQYQTKEGFDSGIVESPRSIRPFKPASRVSVSRSKHKKSPRV